MYEANPMAMILEQAGGRALACAADGNGVRRILEIQPESIHQRTSVMLGSSQEIETIVRHLESSSRR
jgi:fructose-1,6-bisphosphatase I